MSKWYVIFAVAVYATIKIAEQFLGESDIYTIIVAAILALAIFLGVLLRRKANVLNAVLLIVPMLVIVCLLSLRHFFQVGLSDWMIWTAGLVAGILCLGIFQPKIERRL